MCSKKKSVTPFLPSSLHGAGKLTCFDSTYLFSPCQCVPQLPGILGYTLEFL